MMATEDSSKKGYAKRHRHREATEKGKEDLKQNDEKNLISKFKLNLSNLLTPFLRSVRKSFLALNPKSF